MVNIKNGKVAAPVSEPIYLKDRPSLPGRAGGWFLAHSNITSIGKGVKV